MDFTMKGSFLFLWLLTFFWTFSHGEQLQDFMTLTGPLTNHFVRELKKNPSASQILPSGAGGGDDVFDCSDHLPTHSRDYFQYLQDRGVTHYKVPLSWLNILPAGDPSQPHDDTVTCYRTLMELLTQSGIQPVIELHRSALPEGLSITYGGWENPDVVQLFKDYADFVLMEFADLADTYITFSYIHELKDLVQIRHALHVHSNVYTLYHNKGKLENMQLFKFHICLSKI